MTKSIYDQLVTSNTNSLVYNVSTGGSQFNGMGSDAPSGGVRARQGVKILANFAGIGSTIQNVTIGIRKNGTVSGLVNVQYINSSYTVLATASMNASDLGNGDTDAYTFKLSSQVTIASGDRLLIQYNGTAWSNGVILNGVSGTRPTNTTYTYEGTLNSNSFTDGSGSGVPMMTFDSVLSGVTRQRFVENFSGDSLDTDRWGTVTQIVATCSASMDDTVNGGFKFETDSGAGSPSASMTFIDVKQFNATASTCIATCKKNDDNLGIKIGLADNSNVSPTNHSLMVEGTLESFKSLHTKNSGGFTSTATTEALSQTEFSFKIENIGSSSTLYINGVSGAVSTTNLPAGNLMPYYYIQSRSTAAVKSYNSTYMECYNT